MHTRFVHGLVAVLLFSLFISAGAADSVGRSMEADVVVYCATPAGICAAVAAAREGRSVILVEPGRRVGGLLDAGFRLSDCTPVKDTLGGLALKYHGEEADWLADRKQVCKLLRPQQYFRAMLDVFPLIKLLQEHRVSKVIKVGGRLTALELENAPPDAWGVPVPSAITEGVVSVRGLVFIDASYEGDVMAGAGVKYALGRESKDEYRESLAGVRGIRRFPGISPYVKENDPKSGLLAVVAGEPVGEPGSASPYGMAFAFKFSWLSTPTKMDAGFRLPVPRPADAVIGDFLHRIREAGYRITWPHYELPRDELCSGFLPGLQRDYAEGGWAVRSRIWKSCVDYVLTLTDFTSKDARLVSGGAGDSSCWPHQLHMRGARRMKGAYVLTQADVACQTSIQDSIGLGFHAVDMYPARLGVLDDGLLVQEGGGSYLVSPGPFALPYRALVPKKEECENLLVPVCFSASHVAYAAAGQESQFMVLGEAAGVAAAQAVAGNKAVQDVAIEPLQARLRQLGQKIAWDDKSNYGRYYRSYPGHVPVWWHAHEFEYKFNPPLAADPSDVLVDDADAVRNGRWLLLTREQPFIMEGYLRDTPEGKGLANITYRANLRTGGEYNLYISYIASRKRSSKVPLRVRHAGGESRLLIDQTVSPNLNSGRFMLVGQFKFKQGEAAAVTVSTEGTEDGEVIADAVLFTPLVTATSPDGNHPAADKPPAAGAEHRPAGAEEHKIHQPAAPPATGHH